MSKHSDAAKEESLHRSTSPAVHSAIHYALSPEQAEDYPLAEPLLKRMAAVPGWGRDLSFGDIRLDTPETKQCLVAGPVLAVKVYGSDDLLKHVTSLEAARPNQLDLFDQ